MRLVALLLGSVFETRVLVLDAWCFVYIGIERVLPSMDRESKIPGTARCSLLDDLKET